MLDTLLTVFHRLLSHPAKLCTDGVFGSGQLRITAPGDALSTVFSGDFLKIEFFLEFLRIDFRDERLAILCFLARKKRSNKSKKPFQKMH
ncbi:hypothetical protein D3C87_1536140 [compost metagenome]